MYRKHWNAGGEFEILSNYSLTDNGKIGVNFDVYDIKTQFTKPITADSQSSKNANYSSVEDSLYVRLYFESTLARKTDNTTT